MNYSRIEKEARRLQHEIYTHRQILAPSGPPLLQVFTPQVAARVLQLQYEERDYIAAGTSQHRTAGQIDRGRGIISISREFSFEAQRFTGSHEIGHFVLHPSIGSGVAHRDLPIGPGLPSRSRPLWEQEADYFAACYLAPRKLFIQAFEFRFGPKPLYFDDNVCFYLAGKDARLLATEPTGSHQFGIAVAKAESFGGQRFKSLSTVFGMSPIAVAIRLRELDLLAA